MRSQHSDVLVVGGGIIGLACAYYLVRAGRSVRLIEKATIGAGASHANCGLIFVSDLPPLCQPGAISHEVIRTLRGTSPLHIRPRLDLSLILWLLRFAANCNPRHLDRAVKARYALLRTSDALFDDLFRDEMLDCEVDRRGVLMAFTDPAALEAYAATNRLLAPFGLAAAFHDRRSIHTLEPALSDRVCGGWHHRTDSHLRPERLVAAWADAIRQQGVRIDEGCRLEAFDGSGSDIKAVHTSTGRFTADRIVLATGVWTPTLVRGLGLRLPIQPGKGYSITFERPAAPPRRPCYLVEPNVVVTPFNSGLRLGGTMAFSGFDTRLNERRLSHLERSASRYLRTPPGDRVTERWCGLRPMSPDDLPIIDRVPGHDRLYVASGHGMLGFTTATGTGRLMADMILAREPCVDPGPFSIRRFM